MRTLASIVLTMAVVVPAAAQQQVDRTRPAAQDGTVTISLVSGSVHVTGWDRGEVHVKGTLGRDVERLDVTGNGRHTKIETVEQDHCENCEGSDLVIQVPAGSRVEVKSVSADVEASGVTGPVDARTISGSVRVSGDPSDVRVGTISGMVELKTGKSPIEARSVSGGVDVQTQAATVKATTVSGQLEVSAGNLDRGTFSSVAGRVQVWAGVTRQGRMDIETVGGPVTLLVPRGIAADFHVSTFSGSIDNTFGPAAEHTGGMIPGKELTFSTGGGGGRVSVKTFSARVILKKH